jgi:prepilin-type N-terminal cleavage/methylation domain-containing protein
MSRKGFTLIELLVVVGLLGLIIGIAVPGLIHARNLGRETAAIAAMRALNDAQAAYASACGSDGYAIRFPTLGISPPGSITGFLSPDLTMSESPVKSGYHYALTEGTGGMPGPNDCNGTPTHTTYYASAIPTNVELGVMRGFATSQEQDIWQDTSGAAPTEPFTASATVTKLTP